jgi:hypothetical protein
MKVGQNMVGAFCKAGASFQKSINERIKGNLELQCLVIKCIDDYEQAKVSAMKNNTSVADIIASTIANRKRKKEEEDEDEKPARILKIENVPLRRGQHVFGNWSPKLARELICFAEKDFDWNTCAKLPKEQLLELLEKGFDVICFGDEKDRVGIKMKLPLFESMKRVYVQNGRPFQGIVIDVDNKMIDWSRQAVVKIADPTTPNTCRVEFTGGVGGPAFGELSATDLNGDAGPFTILRPYSVKSALVSSPSSNYSVANLFPATRRRLIRRGSSAGGDERPKISASEARLLAAQAKAKTKAKAKGKVAIASRPDPAAAPAAVGGKAAGKGSASAALAVAIAIVAPGAVGGAAPAAAADVDDAEASEAESLPPAP